MAYIEHDSPVTDFNSNETSESKKKIWHIVSCNIVYFLYYIHYDGIKIFSK